VDGGSIGEITAVLAPQILERVGLPELTAPRV
jgi:hypothetical protein